MLTLSKCFLRYVDENWILKNQIIVCLLKVVRYDKIMNTDKQYTNGDKIWIIQ